MQSEHTTEVSSRLVLTCTVQNDPDSPHPLEITWYKGDDNMLSNSQDGRYEISQLSGQDNITIAILKVLQVQKDDAGRYSCHISPGDISTETTVVVKCE